MPAEPARGRTARSLRSWLAAVDEARRMIDEIQGRAMFDGVRGAPPADIDALADALARLSVFAAENADRIETIDINPFLVLSDGAVAVDALIVPKTSM